MDKTAIHDLEAELLEAIKKSDIPTLDRLLHHNLLFVAPNGTVVTKTSDLASHKAGTMVVEEIKSTIEQIEFIHDTAIVVVVYDTKGKMMGSPIKGRFRYIRFWKTFEGQWKVIGGSCVALGA